MTKKLSYVLLLLAFIGIGPLRAGNKTVTASRSGDIVSIGNEYLVRQFSVANGQAKTTSILNQRTAPTPIGLAPDQTCEEFIIRIAGPDSATADLRASVLMLEDVQITTEDQHTQKIVFRYKPYRLQEVDWQVNMVLTMQDEKHYMHKYLQITVPETQRKQARIDYIDFESLHLPSDYTRWTHPEMENGVGGVSGYYIALGQPIYIQGLFFGLEFPAAESEIAQDNVAHIRYYSGKNFDQFQSENRLTNGTFTTWKEVIGAARSIDMDVIQSDFFSYIDDISAPIQLRTQYNSWYDFMMDINESNILASFRKIEKGLTQNGVPPLDSYVVDDGWNAYGPYQNENKAKFWSFNSKFPNGLSTPTRLVHQFASNFGLWLGPRGGYNYNNEFAQFLEDNGHGKRNANSWDIATNHKVYLDKLKTFFLDCQKKYNINYWKLDGFMVAPPQPDPQGNYISGGYKGMYYVTEHWERWIDIFKAMRDARGSKRNDLWINLTCYMNPSPWFLQWVNSVWIQNSGDMGHLNIGRTAQVDQLLSYRDDRYFDFVKTREFQFPLAHVYNHDPIYGNTANLANTMDDDEFCTYLMMMATRGSAFWELYYSSNMMDEGEKWAVNAYALQWIRDNYPILRHAKLIGQTPAKGAPYGYSAWAQNDGIISVRNPSDKAQEFTITLDRNIGMGEGLKKLYRTTEWSFNTIKQDDNSKTFSYGEQLKLNLEPGEVRIWKFSTSADKEAPVLKTVKTISPSTLTAEFSEPITVAATNNFTIDGVPAKNAILQGDRCTVRLTLSTPMKKNTRYELKVSGTTDLAGNKAKTKASFYYFDGQQIPQPIGISGTSDFNISFVLKTNAVSIPILYQGKEILVAIADDGRLVFYVKGVKIVSSLPVNSNRETPISLCREKNGMLKIYVYGGLDRSEYDSKIVNPAIKASPIIVNRGLEGPQGVISKLSILNYALDYKANEALVK